MSDSTGSRGGGRRRQRLLSPSEKYEAFVQVTSGEVSRDRRLAAIDGCHIRRNAREPSQARTRSGARRQHHTTGIAYDSKTAAHFPRCFHGIPRPTGKRFRTRSTRTTSSRILLQSSDIVSESHWSNSQALAKAKCFLRP